MSDRELWRSDPDHSADTCAAPAIVDDVVYFLTGSWDEDAEFLSLHPISVADGQELWNWTLGSPPDGDENSNTDSGGSDSHNLIIDGDCAYFTSLCLGTGSWRRVDSDTYVYCIDINTGEQKWRFNTGKGGVDGPVKIDDILYVLSDKLIAIDADSGTGMWLYAPEETRGNTGAFDYNGLTAAKDYRSSVGMSPGKSSLRFCEREHLFVRRKTGYYHEYRVLQMSVRAFTFGYSG